eukprot:1339769-Amorphochlora_amoeboformis.AAC.1
MKTKRRERERNGEEGETEKKNGSRRECNTILHNILEPGGEGGGNRAKRPCLHHTRAHEKTEFETHPVPVQSEYMFSFSQVS